MYYRTHHCGALRLKDTGKSVTLAGWVQKNRNLGGMTFIDLRDQYGITQLVFNMDTEPELCRIARITGREYVIRAKGSVAERSNKNPALPTGDIEIIVSELEVLNPSKSPPFTIEDDTDGGEELRMKYRYLDLRRNPLKEKLLLRHRMLQETRKHLSGEGFIEIETPNLIRSTPEGARDFVVPSRLHPGRFYALPQSPQTFKQLIMMAGFDKYFQLVRCFRDEDFRADRQPEFTQIDCELSFVTREEVIDTFNGLIRHLFKVVKGIELDEIPVITYREAIDNYGTDKPDLRFGLPFFYLNDIVEGTDFKVFSSILKNEGIIAGIKAPGCAEYSRKELDRLTAFVREPHRGMKGLVWVKYNKDGSIKSPVDKFFSEDQLKSWLDKAGAEKGDLLLILAGPEQKTRNALGDLRLEIGDRLGLRKWDDYKPLLVIDFPLLEWDEKANKYTFSHHPFTSPVPEDLEIMNEGQPEKVRASSYDFVLNGNECASGSIRNHNREVQEKYFELLGIGKEEAERKFGFFLNSLEYGTPPHGGIAFGFDRWCALFSQTTSIRDVIAFPKNNAGRDLMIDAPSPVDPEQLKDLGIKLE